MIGDRYLTDVVYGNRHGLLTIRPAPLAVKGEPQMVQLVSSLLQALCHSAVIFAMTGHPFSKKTIPCLPLCTESSKVYVSGAQYRGQVGEALDAPRIKGQLSCH